MQLAVLAVAELLDRDLLGAVEARGAIRGVRGEDRAQHREWDRHDHAIDDALELSARPIERQRPGAVAVHDDSGEGCVELHGARRQRRRDRLGQALVATLKVIALV